MFLLLTMLAEDSEPPDTLSSQGVHSKYKTLWLFSRWDPEIDLIIEQRGE